MRSPITTGRSRCFMSFLKWLRVTDHIFRAVDQQQLTAMVLNYRPQQGLRRYLPQYTSQTTQPRHIKLGCEMVQELPHGPQAVYSIRHLSIWWAYDNTWRASRLHLRLLFNLYTNDLPPQLSPAVPTPTLMILRSTAPFRLKTWILAL